MNLITKAKDFAIDRHKGQFRRFSGEAYVEHPKRVAQTVLKYKESKEIENLYIASLLHDVVEDTETTLEEIERHFGELVASIVGELTSKDGLRIKEKAEYLSKKMINMSSWALVIKLSDRLDNVADLRHVNKSFRIRYVNETKEIISNIIIGRYLSVTHLNIIHDILKEINGVSKLDIL